MVIDEELAKDIVQSVWLKSVEQKWKTDDEAKTKALLFISVKNKCLDYLKAKHYRDLKMSNFSIEEVESDALYFMIHAETLRLFDSKVEELTGNYKVVFKLAYYEGLSSKEISERLQMPYQTVRNTKAIAVNKLKSITPKY